jgi:hypothetical protein
MNTAVLGFYEPERRSDAFRWSVAASVVSAVHVGIVAAYLAPWAEGDQAQAPLVAVEVAPASVGPIWTTRRRLSLRRCRPIGKRRTIFADSSSYWGSSATDENDGTTLRTYRACPTRLASALPSSGRPGLSAPLPPDLDVRDKQGDEALVCSDP